MSRGAQATAKESQFTGSGSDQFLPGFSAMTNEKVTALNGTHAGNRLIRPVHQSRAPTVAENTHAKQWM
jgi:hypothetical protein